MNLLRVSVMAAATSALLGCVEPAAYSIRIVQASKAIAEAEVAGAPCTEAQLDALSPVTLNQATESGQAVASSEDNPATGTPMCAAPFEYYSAIEYRAKAREEMGYSDYESALKYAKKSLEYAEKARDIALNANAERGR